MFVSLSKIATVSLGFKSLQNAFFYVNQATIDTYGIEGNYLTAILMRRDMDTQAYYQNPPPHLWLLNCRARKEDMRGSGALKYIEAMADRSATEKKQAGKSQTIREALDAQGGGLWYAPKARPNLHHIWIRKAFDGVFSPYLFEKPALVDQRFNSIAPHEGIDWRELAAVLTSALFSYSLEINGSASMGAGALEAPTTKLRGYPVFDPRSLTAKDRKALVTMAGAVWKNEPPVDWTDNTSEPSKHQKALDAWLLAKAGGGVTAETLYSDLRDVCRSRIFVAKDKDKKTRKRKSDSIGDVAVSIARTVAAKIQSRNFPDDFSNGTDLDLDFSLDRKNLQRILISQLMDQYDIKITTKAGGIAYEGNHVGAVAEVIIRSILWGRSIFSVSSSRKAMENAVADFITWISKIDDEIDSLIADSALGTGYEEALKREVFLQLGVHPLAGAKTLPTEITL